MSWKLSSNKENVAVVLDGLKKNDGYCPCVVASHGKKEFKCPCEDFRYDVPIGEECICGLFIKTGDEL